MSASKKGSKKTPKRPTSKRKVPSSHVIDYHPESPVIREHEAEERRRRGFRTAMWMIAAMIVVGLGWVTWHEARHNKDHRHRDEDRRRQDDETLADVAKVSVHGCLS